MCICMYVCMYVYIYIYICIYRRVWVDSAWQTPEMPLPDHEAILE